MVWRDDRGVTCRRWNWRQGRQNPVECRSRTNVVHLESLPAMPLAALHAAGDELIAGLRQMMPALR